MTNSATMRHNRQGYGANGSSQADTPELAKTKLNKAAFLSDFDAFENFLAHVAPAAVVEKSGTTDVRSRDRAGLHNVTHSNKLMQDEDNGDLDGDDDDDDDDGFLSDSDDDESTSWNNRRRQPKKTPTRGVRTNHSGDLERLFNVNAPSESLHSSAERDLIGKKSERSDSKGEKIVIKGDMRRRGGTTDDSKKSEIIGSPRHMHKSGRPASEKPPKRVEGRSFSGSSHSTSDSSSPPSGKDPPRRRRDDLAMSEHSKPRLRRDDLYSSSKRQSSGAKGKGSDRGGLRAASEIDFQAALVAAKKRQAVGGSSLQRRSRISSGSEGLSPMRTRNSSNSLSTTLRRSSGQRNSSLELPLVPQTSPSLTMRRSQASTGSLLLSQQTATKGSRNNLRNSSLQGVYSSSGALLNSSSTPKPTRSKISGDIISGTPLQKSGTVSGGRRDIDDLVLNLKRQSRTGLLKSKHGNATWNLGAGGDL